MCEKMDENWRAERGAECEHRKCKLHVFAPSNELVGLTNRARQCPIMPSTWEATLCVRILFPRPLSTTPTRMQMHAPSPTCGVLSSAARACVSTRERKIYTRTHIYIGGSARAGGRDNVENQKRSFMSSFILSILYTLCLEG